jgi:UDP-N-acetylglucosamine 3-dehydrogenase
MSTMISHSKTVSSAAGEVPGKMRLGIIGCGAIAEGAHLPAALSLPDVNLTALSDTSTARLRQIRADFGLDAITYTDFRETFAKVDAVILALPNTLHAPVASEFLSRGIHVLCEKPLASTSEECEAICQAAEKSGTILAVGYVTRFHPATELTRELIRSGFLGTVQSFDYEFGTAGGWATQSGYNLSRATSGGGVLVVSGSHFMDRMLYFFDSVSLVDYIDDSYGGVEANCVARFRAELQGNPVPGRVTLSKTHRLGNRLRITAEKGVLEVREGQSRSVTFFPSGGVLQHEIFPAGYSAKPEPDFFQLQLNDFVQAIRAGSQPMVSGRQSSQSVILMERCYQSAARMEEMWSATTIDRLRPAMSPAPPPGLPLQEEKLLR